MADQAATPKLDYRQYITWLIAIAALACGGLGGSMLTLWFNNRSTVVEYSTNKTVLGTDQTTVVPNFRVQVGDATLQRLYLYTVKIQYASGPEIENAKLGIDLTPSSAKLVGNTVTDAPGAAYIFKCAGFNSQPKSIGTTCAVTRLGSHVGAYTLSFAADGDVNVDLSIDSKNTEVRRTDFSTSNDYYRSYVLGAATSFVAGLGSLILAVLANFIFQRGMGRKR